jgi:hypothetical protein
MYLTRIGTFVFCFWWTATASAAGYSLEKLETAPEGLPAEVAQAVATTGHRVTGDKGPVCDLWWASSVPVKEGFAPTLSVKYPLQQGQFMGVLQVHKGEEFSDLRGQVLTPGLYMLRYAHQPQDGNHIGTSELADFLLALPAKADQSADALTDINKLNALSADAAGTNHPAIFSMLPVEEEQTEPTLSHDPSHDFWILQSAAGEEKPLATRVIIIGTGDE